MRGFVILSCLAAVACAATPISVEEAMTACTERARAATKPTGAASIGVNSSGKVSSGLTIGVSSDFLTGRDPNAVYRECVIEKSGQQPTRPLNL